METEVISVELRLKYNDLNRKIAVLNAQIGRSKDKKIVGAEVEGGMVANLCTYDLKNLR